MSNGFLKTLKYFFRLFHQKTISCVLACFYFYSLLKIQSPQKILRGKDWKGKEKRKNFLWDNKVNLSLIKIFERSVPPPTFLGVELMNSQEPPCLILDLCIRVSPLSIDFIGLNEINFRIWYLYGLRKF